MPEPSGKDNGDLCNAHIARFFLGKFRATIKHPDFSIPTYREAPSFRTHWGQVVRELFITPTDESPSGGMGCVSC